jgi:hypothetical protein
MSGATEDFGMFLGGLENDNVEFGVSDAVNMEGCVTPDVGTKSSMSPPGLERPRKRVLVESDVDETLPVGDWKRMLRFDDEVVLPSAVESSEEDDIPLKVLFGKKRAGVGGKSGEVGKRVKGKETTKVHEKSLR